MKNNFFCYRLLGKGGFAEVCSVQSSTSAKIGELMQKANLAEINANKKTADTITYMSNRIKKIQNAKE